MLSSQMDLVVQEVQSRGVTELTKDWAWGVALAAQNALEYAKQNNDIAAMKDIRDKVHVIGEYAKRQKAQLVASNILVAQRIRTEREIGKIIPEMFPHGGNQKARSHDVTLENHGITKMQSSRYQSEANICDDADFETWAQEYLEDKEFTTAEFLRFFSNYHVSDDTYEWNTPSEYIEAARLVMGGIDLDPASNEIAQKIVRAEKFFTVDDDGLSQPWSGNVWLNPPYNMPYIEQFADRAIYEYEHGNISAAIVLTNNSTDTGWFHSLAKYPFCLTRGRIKFWNDTGELATRQGQALFYLGTEPDVFLSNFMKFGIVVKRYDNS